MQIGAVADDITGATDLCLMLSRAGLRTVQVMGVPEAGAPLPEADAVVISLKSRTIPATEAVALSLAAARSLQQGGARRILFKHCSTFDSTDAGNIGPVSEALLDFTGADLTVDCPAFPENGRTVYQGHLFVGEQLLSDSPMKDHPLTPMRDANLVRVLGRQTSLPVGLLAHATLCRGVDAARAAMAQAAAEGFRILVADALTDSDLMTLGAACRDLPLVAGGSGIAMGLAGNFGTQGTVKVKGARAVMPAPPGRSVMLAGSCSAATRGQIGVAQKAGAPSCPLDAVAIANGAQTARMLADWAIAQAGTLPPLIFSSADPETLTRVQGALGREASGALVEHTLAEVARLLLDAGFTRFLVAGGETAGAVVDALGVTMLEIGCEIDPGVAWARSVGGPDVALALKSGNFGAPDFLLRAWSLLEDGA